MGCRWYVVNCWWYVAGGDENLIWQISKLLKRVLMIAIILKQVKRILDRGSLGMVDANKPTKKTLQIYG